MALIQLSYLIDSYANRLIIVVHCPWIMWYAYKCENEEGLCERQLLQNVPTKPFIWSLINIYNMRHL